jgi:radical SAM superfamily enzyme YgiQ (UPF0313 family)
MVYKKGPRFSIRPVEDIERDMAEAAEQMGNRVRTLFFPAGNSLAMPTKDLAQICRTGHELFPDLQRITVYASMQSILTHGLKGLTELAGAGLTRLHVGLESGHGPTLLRAKKGVTPKEQARAGSMALEAGLELNLYVLLGLAGPDNSQENALATARVLNRITTKGAVTVRLRTLVPKINTLLLHQINKDRFTLCTPHQILREAHSLITGLAGPALITSDHYTNYINLEGNLPKDRPRLAGIIDSALKLPREAFRKNFIGTQ